MTAKEKKAELVGAVLRREREKQGLTLGLVELDTKIRNKYLTKIEDNDYSIPNDIYIRGFVQTYANYLGLDGGKLAKQYEQERGGLEEVKRDAPKPVRGAKLNVSRRWAIGGATLAVILIVVGYLAYQFSALAAAPRLDITSPVADQSITGGVIDVSGKATPGTDVFINDSAIVTDANGGFNDKLTLADGLNTIRITAQNKLGKSTTISRNILAHIPQAATSLATLVPKDKFDGAALGVKVKDKATLIVVTVDGQEAFRGTMLAGTTQSFSGKTDIKVTTGDAGQTALIVTNSQVNQKTLDPLGKSGETKRDLDFAKDTVIQ